METLNILYLVIYWKQKLDNGFIFLCSLRCHLSATLQIIIITVANLQDNRAVFRIFIALLSFPFQSHLHKLFTHLHVQQMEETF